MAGKGPSTGAVVLMAGGGLFLWSGFHGASITGSLRDLIAGKQPPGTETSPLTSGGSGSGGGGDTGAHTGTAKQNQGIGRLLAAAHGWGTGQQWDDLVALWNRESGWDNTAQNSSSGAYGIPQALPPSKLPKAGQPPSMGGSASASAQISWGLSYIKQRYGSPSAAWAHEQSVGWY